MLGFVKEKGNISKLTKVAIFLALALVIAVPSTVSATTSAGTPFISGNEYCRILTTVESVWTPQKYMAGQPTYGTYLNKGDGMYYSESGGVPATITVGLGYNAASISITVPLGQRSSGGVGYFKTPLESGYYKLAAKKYVKVTATTRQECTIGSYRTGNPIWVKAWQRVSYETLKTVPVLVKQN